MEIIMNFTELASNRYSCRKFKDFPVTDEHINEIVKAGHLAPTGCNFQPQRIVLITSDDAIAKLQGVTRCHFGCKTAILVCYNKDECWTRKYDGKTSGVSDACSVLVHMLLKATELGVGTTWVMHFNPEKAAEAFNIPENVEPVGFIMMGYPADDAVPSDMHSSFRPIEDVIVRDSF